MIKDIAIHAPHCFGTAPLPLTDLGPANFIFAPNGSGKTTISRTLAQQPASLTERATWQVAPTTLSIRVYNEDYRNAVVVENVDGIFSLGENNAEKLSRIKTLEGEIENFEKLKTSATESIGSDSQSGPSGLKGELLTINSNLESNLFTLSKSKEIGETTRKLVFKGYINSKHKFRHEAMRRFEEEPTIRDGVNWDRLKAKASVLSSNEDRRKRLTIPSVIQVINESEAAELKAPLTSVAAGTLASHINQASSQDWVNKGRKYLAETNDKCPFCNQSLPDAFHNDLEAYFASGFDLALERYESIFHTAKRNADILHGELKHLKDEVLSDQLINHQEIVAVIDEVSAVADLALERIRFKLSNPSHPVEVNTGNEAISHLMALVLAVNHAISEYNILLDERSQELDQMREDGWNLFLNDPVVSRALKEARGLNIAKRERIKKHQEEIDHAQDEISKRRDEISSLRKGLANTEIVADRINKLLRSMGFSRFELAPSDTLEGGYTLVRLDQNRSSAASTLSEGERSFLSFAYYWESLLGSPESDGIPENVIAVIDDPISSLDSDVLFLVASKVREAARMALESSGNVKQVIVLTHNTQFHREASYSNPREPGNRKYYRLIKPFDGGPTEVRDDGIKSRIRGSYATLWDAVVEAARNKDESSLTETGIYNIVRRILEGYFKILGGINTSAPLENVNPHEQHVIDTFDIWANAGSHTIADDFDQAVHVGGTKNFLRLFHQYFQLCGHGAHFDMMITASDGEDLLDEGKIFGNPSVDTEQSSGFTDSK